MPGIEVVLALALLAPVVWLMERTHRTMRALPRRPWGTPEESQAAADYRSELRELRAIAQATCRDTAVCSRFGRALRSL